MGRPIRRISERLDKQINEMVKKIREVFGIKISKVEATKIIAWKSRSYNMTMTHRKLLEILGDKNEQ